MSSMSESERNSIFWILYDGRACGGFGTVDASIFAVCNSEIEAEDYRGTYGTMACYSYEKGPIDSETGHTTLIHEEWEWDYYA